MTALTWFDDSAGIFQINGGGRLYLDRRFWTIRIAYLRGHLTLREATRLQNLEVELRRLERRA